MTNVLIACFSAGGITETMAEYIAEGVRFSGNKAVTLKIENIKSVAEIAGYDGYIFGSPTYSLDLPGAMKQFLATVSNASLEGKLGGTFGPYKHDASYRHDNHAPAIIFEMLVNVHRMKPFELGALTLQEDAAVTRDGMRACQDYGRVFGERVTSDSN